MRSSWSSKSSALRTPASSNTSWIAPIGEATRSTQRASGGIQQSFANGQFASFEKMKGRVGAPWAAVVDECDVACREARNIVCWLRQSRRDRDGYFSVETGKRRKPVDRLLDGSESRNRGRLRQRRLDIGSDSVRLAGRHRNDRQIGASDPSQGWEKVRESIARVSRRLAERSSEFAHQCQRRRSRQALAEDGSNYQFESVPAAGNAQAGFSRHERESRTSAELLRQDERVRGQIE